MANPGDIQALVAAFAFGILVNAASAAVVLFTRGHGLAIFRDRLRLALTIFLGSSALWALTAFISTLIDTTALSACQTTVTFSTTLDQVARIAIEQYIVSLAQDEKSPLGLLPQFLVALRLVLGIVFVGFTRSTFQPTCVPMSNEVPLSISVIVMDAMILVLLAIQFLSKSSGKDVQERQLHSGKVKSFLLLAAGLTIWMGTSVTMLLGLGSIDLVFKTTVPAIGLVILIAILTLLSGFVIRPLGLFPRHSELPTSRATGGARNLASSGTTYYPPSRYEDIKEFGRSAISRQINPASGLPVVRGLGNSVTRPPISRPILIDTESAQNVLSRIPTVDLATAARNEKRRREDGKPGPYLVAAGQPPLPPDQSAEEDTAEDIKWKNAIPTSSVSRGMSGSDSQKTAQRSPTQLPPLPPPPKSAGHISRPHPNNTQSMTFVEKMDFFYAPPLSAFSAATTSQRTSSVSAMPPVLNASIESKLPPSDAIVKVDSRQRRSIMSNNSSVRTASVLDLTEVPGEMRRSTVLPIAEGPRDKADDSEKSELPGIPEDRRRSNDRSQVNMKRNSSPVLPSRLSGFSTVTEESRDWGSLHSAVVPVHLQQARCCARSTYIQLDARRSEPRGEQVDPSRDDGPGEIMTVMLDSALHAQTRKSFDAENRRPQKVAASETYGLPPFHRRVGDECPTFSRRNRTQSRKMPPPAPLLLNGKGCKKAIIVQSTEPSPQDSPTDACQMIEAQLQKLKQANEVSVRNERDRMTLLHNLELEMGQQENKWQTLQLNIKRDSVSTVKTSPAGNSRPTSTVDAPSQGCPQRFLPPERVSRRSFLNSSSTIRSRDGDVAVTPSSQSSRNNRASIQRTRLAEAQIENMASTPQLILKHNNLNVLAVSKFSLGSPSPPDTDDESEFDFEAESGDVPQDLNSGAFKTTSAPGLWEPKVLVTATGSSGLWNAPAEPSSKTREHYELPALSVRVKVRKNLEPLVAESSLLWQKNTSAREDKPTSGLWQERILIEPQQPQKTMSRALATRPPRRSKRITLLPDILESPQPLDERGTLGIFQLPSGEKSEHATVLPRPAQIFMAMPGTMTTGGPTISAILEARARRIEDEEISHSTFFDESDEDGGDNFDEFTGRESTGDEFDETTLWEIANLLRTRQVPTRNSLLLMSPCSPSEFDDSVLEGYEDMLSGDEYDEGHYGEGMVEFGMACEEDNATGQCTAMSVKPATVQSHLWSDKTICTDITHFGLPQPDNEVWNAYVAEASYHTHPRSRTEEILPVESNKLWMPSAKDVTAIYSTGLWASRRATSAAPFQSPAKASLLWSKASQPPQSPLKGLFDVASRRSDYRRTSAEPAALYMTRAPRVTLEPLEQLTTTGLWNTQKSNLATFSHRTVHRLWKKSAVITMQQSEGLFDIRFKRVDYRRTSQIPAALSMTRKPSIRREPLAELTSRNLWTVQPPSKLLSASGRPSLWTKTVAVTSEVPSLFRIDPGRKVYRTTTADPAALQMIRRPRQLQGSLQELESNSLWENTGRVQAVLDWLSVSSTRPRSPSVYSVSSDSATSSPVSDAFSVKTNVTRASSVAESTMSRANSLGRRHKRTFTEDAVPEVPELPEQFVVKNLDEAKPEKPVRVPLRKLCLPSVAYPADWDAALREAIAASRPNRVARIAATPQEWSAALESAILASYPRTAAGQRSLWVKPTSSPAVAPKGMWTAATATGRSGVDASLPAVEVDTKSYRSRRTDQSTEASPDFGAQRLWRRGDNSPLILGSGFHTRDWLEDTTKRRFTRLQLRY
ncbi:hypothetical protein DL764_010584 [Monosporascus ibericus]|uniref:Uncharacterized protein n=1 Tax=Monosporascus ibericus TaxID=155417 RepID=A0A4Q4SSG9_9PEZI|nr:hypothetical protein DL764_010584 [Monosporascus ibericus]